MREGGEGVVLLSVMFPREGKPPKNGEIALWLTPNSLMYSKYVSQKRNESIDNGQWYNMLLSFML